jgi:uncharacterized protein (TIGR00730 family)
VKGAAAFSASPPGNSRKDRLSPAFDSRPRAAPDVHEGVLTMPSTPTLVSSAAADRVLLEGPHSRRRELALVLRAVREFIDGFRTLHFVGPCVTVFGSARYDQAHPYYALGREVGHGLAGLGFTVMTGGGPGLMEAANRGAREAGGRSVGCTIALPQEQVTNPYLDRSVTCHYFFVRKVLLFKYSYAFIALPGGLGTLDELFEALTLIQTRKVAGFPVVLLGTEYWQPLQHLLQHLARERTIDDRDLQLVLLTDSVSDALEHIHRHAVERFGLGRRELRPSTLLGERAVPGLRTSGPGMATPAAPAAPAA